MRKTAAVWSFAVRPSSWEAAPSYRGYWLCPADCWARLTCLALKPPPCLHLRALFYDPVSSQELTSVLLLPPLPCGPCSTDSSNHLSVLLASPDLLLCPMDHNSPRSYHHGFCSYSRVSGIHLVPTVPSDLLAVWEEMFSFPGKSNLD